MLDTRVLIQQIQQLSKDINFLVRDLRVYLNVCTECKLSKRLEIFTTVQSLLSLNIIAKITIENKC